MSKHIDYYFTSISPFAYLGHAKLKEIAEKHGLSVNFKPFNLFDVWKISGSVPPAERSPVRNRYRLIELQRIAVMRDLCINLKPAFFPTDPSPADHCICALNISGSDPAEFSRAVGKALWEQEKDIGDGNVLRTLLGDCGHDADKIWEIAQSEDALALRARNTSEAISSDAIGAPAYVYRNEVFWGQDRLELLDEMIASGREAFTADI